MKKYLIFILLAVIVLALIGIIFLNISKESKVKQSAIGTELSYYGIDGKLQVQIVQDKDIVEVSLVDCGYIDHSLVNKKCYRVSIGDERKNVFWYIFYDSDSLIKVKVEQLFVT